ncbi:hypothetical protein [Arthrobacter sp. JCM 19049]|uniref:hypothetical protein n=1 Tax=Arthrobacter sp. JCM 19049 TaxID=1460643 RepID=UPI0027959588|nr:hypothetical protein [Arthrobacter sp. JCM 19049]
MWLGGGVVIVPGVSIGHNSVIGAGAVVTRDIPAGCGRRQSCSGHQTACMSGNQRCRARRTKRRMTLSSMAVASVPNPR